LALEHALRPLFAYLRAIVTPTAVYAASEDWGSNGDPHTDTLPRLPPTTQDTYVDCPDLKIVGEPNLDGNC
ncbi:hypothetical protein ACFWSI_45380, partial [Streptomyces sp. NPDC058614]